MNKKIYKVVAAMLFTFCIVTAFSNPVQAKSKTTVYVTPTLNMMSTKDNFKKSHGRLIIKSDSWRKHTYTKGKHPRGKEIGKKKLNYKLAKNCKWTYSYLEYNDDQYYGKSSYKKIKKIFNKSLKEPDHDFMFRIYVKNKKVVRVDMQFS